MAKEKSMLFFITFTYTLFVSYGYLCLLEANPLLSPPWLSP